MYLGLFKMRADAICMLAKFLQIPKFEMNVLDEEYYVDGFGRLRAPPVGSRGGSSIGLAQLAERSASATGSGRAAPVAF